MILPQIKKRTYFLIAFIIGLFDSGNALISTSLVNPSPAVPVWAIAWQTFLTILMYIALKTVIVNLTEPGVGKGASAKKIQLVSWGEKN